MITFKNISKSYGKIKVLDNVNIELLESSINTFLGPNGSGKTTLIKILLGLVKPDNGEIYYKGNNIIGEYGYKEDFGYMTQITNYPENLTANDLFNLTSGIRKSEPVLCKELIEIFQLDNYLNKPLKNLSGGTKQKVNVVISLMFDSKIIVLDEPTVGLDPQSVKTLKEYIIKEKNKGKTILMTSHIMQDVNELSDALNILTEGNVVYTGTIDKLLEQSNTQVLEDAIINIYSKNYYV